MLAWQDAWEPNHRGKGVKSLKLPLTSTYSYAQCAVERYQNGGPATSDNGCVIPLLAASKYIMCSCM